MAEETQEFEKKYTELADDEAIGAPGGGGTSEFDEYIMLPAEEAIKAHVVDIKVGQKKIYQSEELEDRQFFWFELDEGEGKGQRYRYDCRTKLTEGKGKKASNLDELFMKLVGKYPKYGEYAKRDVLGLPIRIELTEPKTYSGREMQFVSAFKKPTTDQKRVAIASADVVPTEVSDDAISDAELDKLFA